MAETIFYMETFKINNKKKKLKWNLQFMGGGVILLITLLRPTIRAQATGFDFNTDVFLANI